MARVQPAPTDNPSRRAAGRRGFTLLEILVVIGIIMLLVAIGVIGFGVLDQSPRVTKTTLANLQSMFAEYENRTHLRDQPQKIYVGDTLTNTNPAVVPPIDLWRSAVVLDNNGAGVGSGSSRRYDWGPVANTQIVLQYLHRLPENKQTMTKFPSKQVLGQADAEKKFLTPTNDSRTIDPPLVLDAWSNPILFVGADGLAGVKVEAKPELQRVTSAGVFDLKGSANDTSMLPKARRPFFASAGPDGDFKTGDDNLYSFQ